MGSPLNFRGLVYSPINEQGVVYLFGLIANDLNIRVENVQQGYPDCTAIRYVGKGRWERINIEFEFKSSNFNMIRNIAMFLFVGKMIYLNTKEI